VPCRGEDASGFLVSETNKESGTTTYQHDVRGILIQKQTPTGNLLMQVDEAGRLLGVMSPQGTLLRQFTYGTTGTDTGKLMEAQAFNFRMGSSCSSTEVRQQYFYDATTGRLASEATFLLQGTSQLESWTQSYTYDGAGRITQVHYPSCTNLCPAPARQVSTIYSYGRPISVSGFANPITYNDNGTLLGITHANQVAFTQTADPNGIVRPGSMRVDAPSPGNTMPWPRESYFYDTAGNVKAIGGKSFAYDADSRVVAATVPAAGAQPYEGFAYDAYGNLISVARGANPGSATTVFFSADPDTNRLTGAKYDDSGEVTMFPLAQGTHYTWDVLGQMTSVNTGTEIWTHIYDAGGERVWSYRTAPSRLDNYMLRGQDGKVLSAFTKVASTYTWQDYAYREGELLGAALSNGTVMHFDVDQLGSVRLETDGSRSIVRYHDFWPYGDEATPLTGSGSERMKFAGQEWDLGVLTAGGDNTSTQDDAAYMHARFYRPIFGRFLSADPHAGSAAEPQTWNRYSYAAGNPLRFTDPTGKYLCSDKALCKEFEEARLKSLKDPATREAAMAYGELGQDNGVTVKFGKPKKGAGSTTGHIEANKEATAMVAKVTVQITPGTKGVVLEELAAHEGTHVLKWEKWAASWDLKAGTYDMSKNPTKYDDEFAAHQATQRVFERNQQTAQFGDCKGCQLGVVNHTPAEVAAAIRRILADPRGIYNVTPENPGDLMDTTDWKK
jgi:RHS repeat-associated protein